MTHRTFNSPDRRRKLLTPRTAQLRKSRHNILPPNADLLHAMVEKVVAIAVKMNGENDRTLP
jgi:hypothetical protein